MSDEEMIAMVNIIIIGDASVGKSNLLLRFNNNQFDDALKPTIGADFYSKTMDLEGQKVNTKFWDTAGQERYRAIGGRFFKDAHGILLVYDVTRKETFDNLEKWINDIEEMSKDDIKVMLIGNKNDLLDEKQVSDEEGLSLAKEKNFFFFETSAKTGENVENAFNELIKETVMDILQEEKKNEIDDFKGIRDSIINLQIKEEEPVKKKGCC